LETPVIAIKTNPLALPFNRRGFAAALLLVLTSSTASAQIYKWIDANGRTHFSERPDQASQATVVESKGSQPASAARNVSPTAQAEYWQERERQFRERRLADKMSKNTPAPTAPRTTAPAPNSGFGETDASRCSLGRAILEGRASRRNGKPIDAYDREVAASDVRLFCK
jgi:hypothetical protein